MKECFKCGETKPLSEYYPHPRMGDGHLNKCKECTKRDSLEREKRLRLDPNWVIKERERGRKKAKTYRDQGRNKKPSTEKKREIMARYFAKYPEKNIAHRLSQNIKPEPCEICGCLKVERHHDDYSKPREVRWLCKKHHMEYHIKARENELWEKTTKTKESACQRKEN